LAPHRDERDPLLTNVTLLLMYAKRRHKPLMNLHKLADAVERGDERRAQKAYDRLAQEVEHALPKYPDIVETASTMSQMSDDELAEIDRLMDSA
jgi:hypothetical protein